MPLDNRTSASVLIEGSFNLLGSPFLRGIWCASLKFYMSLCVAETECIVKDEYRTRPLGTAHTRTANGCVASCWNLMRQYFAFASPSPQGNWKEWKFKAPSRSELVASLCSLSDERQWLIQRQQSFVNLHQLALDYSVNICSTSIKIVQKSSLINMKQGPWKKSFFIIGS